MLFLIGAPIILGALALPFLLHAADLNGDNLDDAWEAQYGISTNAYDAANLVGWWQLNGTNSTDAAVDRSGNHIDGTLTNFPSIAYQAGVFSNALAFTTNSTVGFPTTNSVLNVGTNFTYSAWFQATQTNATAPTIIADWHDSASKGWQVGASATGAATITLYDGATQTVAQGTGSPVNLYDGGWHQIAATVDTNSVVTVYADGAPEATNSVTGWSPGAVSSFTFGAQGSTNNVAFNLDEVRLYNRAMAAREVPRLPSTYSDLNGSGLSVFEDQVENLNPRDTNTIVSPSFASSGLTEYYGASSPVLTKTGGDTQTVAQNSFATNALVLHVADASNNPLTNAPVTFSIQSGSAGLLSQTNGGSTTTSISLTTDGSGNATVYYESGADVLKNNVVVASAVSQTGTVSTSFTEYCGVQDGLATWLDADAGITADGGGNVSQWTDQSVSGNSATQGTSGIQPVVVTNSLAGHPTVRFDGGTTYLTMPRSIQDDFTMVVVFRSVQGTGSGDQWYNAGGIVDGETPGQVNDFGMSLDPAGEVLTGVGNPDTSVISSTGGYNDGRGHIATFLRTESSGQFSQYLDSVFQNSQTGNTGTLDSPPQITIGATQTLSQFFGGDVAEVLLYQRNLSGDEQSEIEGFLADKYGLYSASATWPLAYNSDVQAQITANHWTQAEADAYVTFTEGSPSIPAQGLLLWLEANAGVTADPSGNVVTWGDQSPSGHILNQTSNSGVPVLQNDANGNPTIRFDGGQALYMPDYLPANGDVTIISLASVDTPGNFQTELVVGSPDNNTTRGFGDFYGSMNFDTYNNGAGGGPVSSAGENAISTITYNRGTGNVNFYIQGNYNGYSNISVNDLTSGFVVGNSADYGAPWTGTISEVLVYNRVLSDSDRAQAEGYVADGYGIYNPAATWPLTYGVDVQELIVENGWSKAQADAYVASLGTNVREVVLAPPPGHYGSSQSVTATSATSGATIYYTTDGSKPTTSSSSVTNGGTLTVSATTRFRFLAVDGTDANSPVTSAVYLIGSSSGTLAAGDSFTMVNKPDGSVWTWGDDGRGQEGDNQATNPTPFPQQVSGLGTIVNVAAAGDHALAVDDSGNVWAWGADDQSQGGDGGTNDLLVPTQVGGLSNIATVWAGSINGFAVDASGNLYGWGNNDGGQLGDGTNNSESTPEPITSVSNVVKVVSSYNFTMVLESDGTIWVSGNNDSGELGDATYNGENIFQQVPNMSDVVDIAVGDGNALALRSDGTVWAWGNNWDGELGNGNFDGGTNFPKRVLGLPRAAAVEAVNSKCFVVLADGTVRSFGANGQGNLGMGLGNANSQATPIQPPGVRNVALLAAGNSHTVICTTSGAFFGWGDNTNYRLTEDFAPNTFMIDSEVHDPTWQNVTQVVSDDNTTVALKSDGTVWAVGEGDNGTLGNNDYFNTETPVQAVGLSGVTKIAGCSQNAFAIDSSGNLWGWGGNWSGQLGVGDNGWRTYPVQVSTVANVTDVASGDSHMLAVESDGSVWAVGDDSQSELGDGATDGQMTPIQVSGLTNATKVAAGSNTSFMLDSSGTVWAWGENESGQLGLGTTDNVTTPTQITGLPAMVAISAKGGNGIGIDTSGNVWTWGVSYGNWDGTPLEQTGISNVTAVAAAYYHVVALESDGTVWGLGSGWLGALGNDSFNDDSSFTQFGGVAGVRGISASYANTLLVKGDGTVSGFGECQNGQLAANLGVYAYAHKPLFGIGMNETPPSISITAPTTSGTATENGEIDFQASASASAGSITKVEYYLNGVRVGTSTAGGNWNYSWSPTVYGELVFEAVAYDSAGVAGISQPVTVTVAYSNTPGAPGNVVVTSGPSGTAYLGWNNSGNATTILIQEENSDGSWTTIATLTNPKTRTYDITGLSSGQSYNFRVVEENANGSNSTSISYPAGASNPPILTKIGGDAQTVAASTFEVKPLVVHVADSGGRSLNNVSVVFGLASGSDGALSLTQGGTTADTQTVTTDSHGKASAYYESGSDALKTNTITANVVAGSVSATASFTALCGQPEGLTAWFTADRGVAADREGNVTQWVDQTSNAYSVSQNTSGSEPQLGSLASGQKALNFNGSQFLSESDTTLSGVNDVTIISVASSANPSGYSTIAAIGQGYGNNGCRIFGYGSGDQQFTAASTVNGGSAATTTEPIINSVTYSSSSSTANFYSQGIANGSASVSSTPVTSSLTLGSCLSYSGYQGWDGQIAEVLIFDRVLTESEREAVELYLADKYGVYAPNADWIEAYSAEIQLLINSNHWDKIQADSYLSFVNSSGLPVTSGVVAWYKADAGVQTTSGAVTQWNDQTPAHFNIAQSTTSSAPTPGTDSTTGLPVLQFNGTQWLSSNATPSGVNDVTIIAVASTADTTGNKTLVGMGPLSGTGQARALAYNNGDLAFCDGTANGQTTFEDGGPAPAASSLNVSEVTYSSAANLASFYSNGMPDGTSVATAGAIGGSFSVGSLLSFTDYYGWNGSIAEILVYNRVLSTQEREQIESYLENKYSITPNAPVLIGPATAIANVTAPFSYQIQSTGSATSYSATGLPSGLNIDSTTGVISGTPSSTGTSTITIGATNSGGTGTATLTLTVYPAAAPVISSRLVAYATINQSSIPYQLTASNVPTSYSASGLPSGLSLDTATGIISGTPSVSGTYSVAISASNTYGTGSATLTFTVYPALPVTDGLVAWFNAGSGITTSGMNVSHWNDQSGNGYNISQLYSSNQPQVSFDPGSSQPVVSYANDSQYLANPAQVTGIDSITVVSASQSEHLTIGNIDEFGTPSIEYTTTNSGQNLSGTSSNAFHARGSMQVNAVTVDSSSNTISFYFQGQPNGSTQNQYFDIGPVVTPGLSLIGAGNVGDVVIYNRVLSATELQEVETYLANKYNVQYTLPAPSITPDGGSATSVTISTIGSATVHYTLDGSSPTSSSPVYSGAITLTQSCSLSCAYFLNNVEVSPVATAQFYVGDTDEIGISDGWQIEYFGSIGIDPNALSPGGSGLTNLQAYLYGYNPTLFSTNGDGLSDLVNHQLGIAATDTTISSDGLTNAQNLALGIDPFNPNEAPVTPPARNPSDHTAPVITLMQPGGATLLP